MKRLLVTGSRDLNPADRQWGKWMRAVDRLIGSDYEVVHGAARGVDGSAGRFFENYSFTVHVLPVTPGDWEKQGKAAGQIRNMRMARGECACHVGWNKPSLVLAVAEDLEQSLGTKGCVFEANRAGIPVLLVSPD